MKIIRNKYIPFSGYKAINLFGVLFVKNNAKIDEVTLNHEAIHSEQLKELLYVFFYIWYVIEWLIRLIRYRDTSLAYRNISFEREAYIHEKDLKYVGARKRFSFFKYI